MEDSRAAENLSIHSGTQAHKGNPGALPSTRIFTLSSRGGTSLCQTSRVSTWRHKPGADPAMTPPWRHLGLLLWLLPQLQLTVCTHQKTKQNKTKNKHKTKQKKLSWVKSRKPVWSQIYKAHLSLPPSFFREKPKHEIPSFLLCTAMNSYAHWVQSTIPERTPGHTAPLLLFAASSSLSLLGLQAGPHADVLKWDKGLSLCSALPLGFRAHLAWLGLTAFPWLCDLLRLLAHTYFP